MLCVETERNIGTRYYLKGQDSACIVSVHGCQMVQLQTKNPNLGKFWRLLQLKVLVYFMSIWSILRPFGRFYGHLVYCVVIWFIFPVLVCFYRAKSGNPVSVSNYGRRKKCQSGLFPDTNNLKHVQATG
jgi:hypothetical protein